MTYHRIPAKKKSKHHRIGFYQYRLADLVKAWGKVCRLEIRQPVLSASISQLLVNDISVPYVEPLPDQTIAHFPTSINTEQISIQSFSSHTSVLFTHYILVAITRQDETIYSQNFAPIATCRTPFCDSQFA